MRQEQDLCQNLLSDQPSSASLATVKLSGIWPPVNLPDVLVTHAPESSCFALPAAVLPQCAMHFCAGGSEPAEAGKQEEASEEEIAKALAQHLVQVAAKAQRACTRMLPALST